MTGGSQSAADMQMALSWVLNLSDGRYSLLQIALRSKLPYKDIRDAAKLLIEADLLVPLPSEHRFKHLTA